MPAAPTETSIRLFIDTPISADTPITVTGAQAHYLSGVMRLRPGQTITVFDDVTGAWRAEVNSLGKRTVELRVVAFQHPRETVPDLWLGAAPIRRARFDWVAEKACELGVARFTPVLTRRAVVDKVRDDRLRAHMIEAAEQCGRSALPKIGPATPLSAWLATVVDRVLFFADEAGGIPIADAVRAHPGPAAILIGPEGGFDDAERASVRAHPGAIAVTLGPRILRADTAAVAAIAIWMSVT